MRREPYRVLSRGGTGSDCILKEPLWGFLVAQVKNLPAYARDTGSIPDPRKIPVPQSNKACVPKLLNLRSRAQELQLEATCPSSSTAQQEEKLLQREAEHHTPRVRKQHVRGRDKCVDYTQSFPRSCQLILLLAIPVQELSYILYLPPGMPGNTASIPDIQQKTGSLFPLKVKEENGQ